MQTRRLLRKGISVVLLINYFVKMCFTGEMSAGFAAMGLFATYWIYNKTENTELASGKF